MHDREYPSPEYLRSVTFLGNVETEGEMDSITPGSQHIVMEALISGMLKNAIHHLLYLPMLPGSR
jgi:hypothetical protein